MSDGRHRPRAGLLALDVDGTLLRSDGTLAERNREALAAADRTGWHVALVTGRPLSHALPLARELGIGAFVVAANGATIGEVATGAVLEQSSLPGHVVRAAIAAVRRALPDVGLAVTTTRGFHAEPGFDVLAPLTTGDTVVVGDACPLADDTVHSTVLFVLTLDTATVLDRVTAAVAAVGVEVHVSPSGLPGSVELTAPGVHKGTGVARLCARIGVARRDVVAFGDGLNDVEMLAWAGHGIAMGNADAALEAVADEVTASNDDDGVAVAVERLLAAGRR